MPTLNLRMFNGNTLKFQGNSGSYIKLVSLKCAANSQHPFPLSTDYSSNFRMPFVQNIILNTCISCSHQVRPTKYSNVKFQWQQNPLLSSLFSSFITKSHQSPIGAEPIYKKW